MQTVDTETYKKMVDSLGIEEAYKQRFRGTGRTQRDILKLAIKLSEGKTVEIHTAPVAGNTRQDAVSVLINVEHICRTLGMDVDKPSSAAILYNRSGGSIRIVDANANRRGERVPHEMEVFTLHHV